ncbi:hypothetical protein Tco_0925935 [Tanacetum coccineum]|uniref:Reverse transcriptase domain-containing protein n=1 Tax=Tanacetum coccineum TaxID=301880 RepID=A0ABQ5D899_9ASTR
MTTKHELETLRTRLVSSEREVGALEAGAKAAEQRDEISRDSLGIARDRFSVLQFRVEAAEHRISELLDSRDFDRLEMAELRNRAQEAKARLLSIERHLGLHYCSHISACRDLILYVVLIARRDYILDEISSQRVAAAMTDHEANRVNGNGSQNETSRGTGGIVHTTRGCTYKEFLDCQPRHFKGTEGVVGLARWFEKMESVFHTSNCATNCQVKHATCILLDIALTWWNSHMKTVVIDAAYEMYWKELMTMMTEVYCPRNEIQKMESENLFIFRRCSV